MRGRLAAYQKTKGRNEKCVEGLKSGTRTLGTSCQVLGVGWRVILYLCRGDIDWVHLAWDADCCEDGNEPLFSLQYEEFLGWLGYCKHCNETSAPMCYHLCINTPDELVLEGNFASCFPLRLTFFRVHEYVSCVLSLGDSP